FTPLTDPCVKFIRSLQIVNRWGALVYETQNIEAGDPAYGWNGDWQGKNHPSDVLIWKATFELYNGQVETRSGEITLIR
ncbi:MAG: gliding motility-associated C-terminal domain-containing protein, partial [Saprospiraceae bacterium]|nr:gliding motility-associated C-terminal domain-containing protein [Saprospiraceae bacterium]